MGEISNFTNDKQIIKYTGLASLTYESSQFKAKHTKITKKSSQYLRKTLYQIILPVINNKVFRDYYDLKITQSMSHLYALGHYVKKLLRIIFHLLKTGQQFNPALLKWVLLYKLLPAILPSRKLFSFRLLQSIFTISKNNLTLLSNSQNT